MLTKGQLKAELAAADAKGMPDSAEVKVNEASLNGTVNIRLAHFSEVPGEGGAMVETMTSPPVFSLVQ